MPRITVLKGALLASEPDRVGSRGRGDVSDHGQAARHGGAGLPDLGLRNGGRGGGCRQRFGFAFDPVTFDGGLIGVQVKLLHRGPGHGMPAAFGFDGGGGTQDVAGLKRCGRSERNVHQDVAGRAGSHS